MAYVFEWDVRKAASNLQKHRVSFDEASTVFRDELAMLRSDPDHGDDENRYILLGMSAGRRLLVVAHVERPPRTRLIAARPASAHERRQYEEIPNS